MTDAPPKPSRLSLWMSEHGRPNQLKVEYRATGVDTADTWVVLTVFGGTGTDKKGASIEVRPGEIGRERYGADVYLTIGHAFIVDWTADGRKKLDTWLAFNKREATEIAEYKRLKSKFGDNV